MSTIAVTNVKHPSAVDPAIVLDADGDVTYAGVHDFSAATVTGAPQGLVHIATESFSAVSSVSLNGVFSSTFDAYRVIVRLVGTSGGALNYRNRLAGTDATTDYNVQEFTARNTTLAGVRSTGALFAGVSVIRPVATESYFDIYGVAKSEMTGIFANVRDDVVNFGVEVKAINHTTATAYDGFSLTASAGTITGTVRVYGYANS